MELLNFEPSPWTRNAHLQTLLGEGLSAPAPLKVGQRKILTLSDGDQISYDLYPGTSAVVFTVGHGLTGSNKAKYVKSISYELNKAGHSVIAFNHRNCGDGFGLSRRTYHSGRSQDLGELIQALRYSYPDKKHIAIGFSMSGNILLQLLGNSRYRENQLVSLPDGAIAINPPVNLKKTSALLSKGLNKLYEFNFIQSLRKYTDGLHHHGILTKKYEYSKFTTMSEFDRLFTGPESGFGSAEAYYESSSSVNHIAKINRPTFILTAKDDPFVDHSDFQNIDQNPFLKVFVENHGGHMGYISAQALPHGTRRWMDYAILEFVKNLLKQV